MLLEHLLDILLDAVIDSVRLLPFLIVVYLLIGYLEQRKDNKLYDKMANSRLGGPVIGALVGCMPQCGFSVVGANLYSKQMITTGTLLAIFISTSDEAIPILLANPKLAPTVIGVLAIKVVFAILVGLVIDFVMRKGTKQKEMAQDAKEELLHGGSHCDCCEHSEKESIWLYAIKHSIRIFIFIFIINVILGGLIEGLGEETLQSLLLTNSVFQPALAALIGLIPNCAASIILTEMFVSGALSFGSLLAGLCTGAGVGLIVLFRTNKKVLDNLRIVGILYVTGTLCGMFIQLLG